MNGVMQPTGVIHGEFFPIHTYGKSQCGGNLVCDCCIYRMSHNDIENARKNCPHYQKIQLANLELSQYVALLQSSATPPVTCVSFLTPTCTVSFTPSGLTVTHATASTSITTVASFSKPVFSFPTTNNNTGSSNDILTSLCKSYDIIPATPVTTDAAAAVLSINSTTAALPVTTVAGLPVTPALPVTPPVTCHPSPVTCHLSLVTTTVPVTAAEDTQTRRRHPAGDAAASGHAAALVTTNAVDDILDNSDSSLKELSDILSPTVLDVLEDLLNNGGEKKSDVDGGGDDVDGGGGVGGVSGGNSSMVNHQDMALQSHEADKLSSKALTAEINNNNNINVVTVPCHTAANPQLSVNSVADSVVNPQPPVNITSAETEVNAINRPSSIDRSREEQPPPPQHSSVKSTSQLRQHSADDSRPSLQDSTQSLQHLSKLPSSSHYKPMTESISDEESRESFYSSLHSMSKKLSSPGLVAYVDSEDSNDQSMEPSISPMLDDETEAYITERLYYSYDG